MSPYLVDEPQYRTAVIPAKTGIHGVEFAPNRRTPWIPGSATPPRNDGDVCLSKRKAAPDRHDAYANSLSHRRHPRENESRVARRSFEERPNESRAARRSFEERPSGDPWGWVRASATNPSTAASSFPRKRESMGLGFPANRRTPWIPGSATRPRNDGCGLIKCHACLAGFYNQSPRPAAA